MASEHERVAFLNEALFDSGAKYLVEQGANIEEDDKKSHFFVLDDVNLSIAKTSEKTLIKLKAGQIGKGTGFKEIEIPLADPADTDQAVEIFSTLTNLEPQISEQFRYNADYKGVTISLKYTQTWGYHAELEVLHDGTADAFESADARIKALAEELGWIIASDEELLRFRDEWERTKVPRGEYTSEEYARLHRALFRLALRGMTPEQQEMDSPTLHWLTESLPSERDDNPIELSSRQREVLTHNIPKEWFVAPERIESLHGYLHLSRVGLFAAALARENGLGEREQLSALLAGLVHDIRRVNDKEDVEHGVRSAQWFKENADEVVKHFGINKQEVDLEAITLAIAEHKNHASEISDNWLSPYIITADALDRFRLPKSTWWPKFEMVGLQPSETLKMQAIAIVLSTETRHLEEFKATGIANLGVYLS